MIITKITSGLGNQLFQYAIARNLSLKKNNSLFFDLSYYKSTYESDTIRNFKLHHFNIKYRVLNTLPLVYFSKATKLFPNRSLRPFFSLIKEKQFCFDEKILQSKAGCITLEGFWQSEKYFTSAAEEIRRELVFKDNGDKRFNTYKTQVLNSHNAVSVHIRRGDYVNHPEFSKSFGFIGLDYYLKAIRYMISRLHKCTFFVFSDDKDWVLKNFPLTDNDIFIENTGEDSDVKDLQLMSLCKHHIIANSSFSWWGAWLDSNTNKIVTAPNNWYKNKPDWDTKDLIPNNWIKL